MRRICRADAASSTACQMALFRLTQFLPWAANVFSELLCPADSADIGVLMVSATDFPSLDHSSSSKWDNLPLPRSQMVLKARAHVDGDIFAAVHGEAADGSWYRLNTGMMPCSTNTC